MGSGTMVDLGRGAVADSGTVEDGCIVAMAAHLYTLLPPNHVKPKMLLQDSLKYYLLLYIRIYSILSCDLAGSVI